MGHPESIRRFEHLRGRQVDDPTRRFGELEALVSLLPSVNGDSCGHAHATVPNSAPTPAVSTMAVAPQNVTRIAPIVTPAPRARAANAPRRASFCGLHRYPQDCCHVLRRTALPDHLHDLSLLWRQSRLHSSVLIHRNNITRKLGFHTVAELVLYAVRNDVVHPPRPVSLRQNRIFSPMRAAQEQSAAND